MESIRQAVEKARAGQTPQRPPPDRPGVRIRQFEPISAPPAVAAAEMPSIELDQTYLLGRRVVSYDVSNPHSRAYDMLRVQILRTMKAAGQRVLGITSPTPQCGKTLTALNLAFSIARQPDHDVLIVDSDMQRPQVDNCIGIFPSDKGLLDILEGRTTLESSVIRVRAADQQFAVLPTGTTRRSSELLNSSAMRKLMQDLKRTYQKHYIIVDLPPLLTGSDVVTLLPDLDGVVLVAAVGQSKKWELEESKRLLQSANLVRIVVNKSPEASAYPYYY